MPLFFFSTGFPVQPFLYYGRAARRKGIVGNIFHHHATGSNDAAIPDGHSRTNHHAAAQPTVFTDGNGIGSFFRFATFHVINRMLGRVKLTTRPHLRISPDADVTGIKHHAIIIHKHIFAQHDARAMVALERRVNHRSGRYAGYQVFYHTAWQHARNSLATPARRSNKVPRCASFPFPSSYFSLLSCSPNAKLRRIRLRQ